MPARRLRRWLKPPSVVTPDVSIPPAETVTEPFPLLPDPTCIVPQSAVAPLVTDSPAGRVKVNADLSIPGHLGDGKRKRRAIAALLAMAVLGGVLSLGVRPLIDRISGAPAATAPLRVLVLQPRVNGRGERLQLAALGARLTSVSTLGSLEWNTMLSSR